MGHAERTSYLLRGLLSEWVLWLGGEWAASLALLTACLTDPGMPFILNTRVKVLKAEKKKLFTS